MLTRIITNFFLVLFLVIFELSFVKGLPGIMSDLNLLVVSILFVLALTDFKFSFYWTLSAGFLLDLFSFSSFGVNQLSLISTLIIIHLLLVGFVTDRSLYAFMMLAFAATLANKLLYNIFTYFLSLFTGQAGTGGWEAGFFKSLGAELVLNLLATAILFNIINYLSHKLKPVFLRHKKL